MMDTEERASSFSPPRWMSAGTLAGERLTHDEQDRLGRAWRDNADADAREALILANLRLVAWQARRLEPCWMPMGVPPEDVIQAGTIGLMVGVDRWDPDRARLATYAVHWIRRFIMRHVDNDEGRIRVPIHPMNAARQAWRRGERAMPEIEAAVGVRGLSEPVHEGSKRDLPLADTIVDAEPVDASHELDTESRHDIALQLVSEAADGIVNRYWTREGIQVVIERRLMRGDTLAEVSAEVGISREGVRLMEAKLIKRTRELAARRPGLLDELEGWAA